MKKNYSLLVGLTLSAFGLMAQNPTLDFVSTYRTGIFDGGAAEIVSYDAASQKLVFTNADANTVEILDFSNPNSLTSVAVVSLDTYGDGVNSVSVYNGVMAVAVEDDPKQDPGVIVFFDMNGTFISQVTVGALPDMVTFTPDGNKVLVANEGEPNDDYTVDPDGTISIIDVSGGVANLTQADVTTLDFSGFSAANYPDVRVFGPNADLAADVEPEYITVSDDSQTAYAVMQENNALAVIDLSNNTITALLPLGFKDHSIAGNGIDASDRDDMINITTHPVFGMYMPDAIAYGNINGQGYIFTANEGDARDYSGFSEEERIKDITLDSTVFANVDSLQDDEVIGRLNITTTMGDTDGDAEYEELYAYGTRSFSVWNATTGALVWDSGDQFEQITSQEYPNDFNANNDENDSFESRSDNKGPEPEAVEFAVINGIPYALVGLERIGGIMVYDVSNPTNPQFVLYTNNRDFSVVNAELPAGGTNDSIGDLGVEDILFIPASEGPNGQAYVVTSNEVSGTISVFQPNNFTVSVSEETVNSFVVYPNPAKGDEIRVSVEGDYTIYDLSGRMVGSANQTNRIDISELVPGTYVIRSADTTQMFIRQ